MTNTVHHHMGQRWDILHCVTLPKKTYIKYVTHDEHVYLQGRKSRRSNQGERRKMCILIRSMNKGINIKMCITNNNILKYDISQNYHEWVVTDHYYIGEPSEITKCIIISKLNVRVFSILLQHVYNSYCCFRKNESEKFFNHTFRNEVTLVFQ